MKFLSGIISSIFGSAPRPQRDDRAYLRQQARDIVRIMALQPNDDLIEGLTTAFEMVGREAGVHPVTESETMWNLFDGYDRRIVTLRPRFGNNAEAEFHIRRDLFSHQMEEMDMRLTYIEEKAAAIEAKMDAAIAMMPGTRMLLKNLKRLEQHTPQLAVQERRRMDHTFAVTKATNLGEIWIEGPRYAQIACDEFVAFIEDHSMTHGEKLNARFKRSRQQARLESSGRQKRARAARIEMQAQADAQQAQPVDTRPAAKPQPAAPAPAPLQVLAGMMAQVRDEREEMLAAISDTDASIALMDEAVRTQGRAVTRVEAEEAQLLDSLRRAVATRRTLAAQINAVDANCFEETREAVFAGFEKKLPLPALPAGKAPADTGMVFEDADADLAPYLTHKDAGVRTQADAVRTARRALIPLERQWTDARIRADELSFRHTYLQKVEDKTGKSVRRLGELLGELQVEQTQMEYMLEDLRQGNGAAQDAGRYPASLADMEPWARENLSGRVIIVRKALKAAARSPYARPDHVYAALELLGREFYDQKIGAGNDVQENTRLRKAFSDAVAHQHLSIGGSISKNSGAYAQDYTASHEGRSYYLDTHLSRGVARDEKFTMRIYFTWDDTRKAVVVGHLPSHLSNALG